MKCRHLLIACLVFVLCGHCTLLANPVGISVPNAFRDAIRGVVAGTPAGSDTVLVQLLGGKNTRFIEDYIWALLETEFARLAPLFVEAQSPPYIIDEGVQAWYWEHADASQREEMLRGLRSWLTVVLPESARYTAWGLKADLRTDWSRMLARVDAAELLADYHDESALPLITSLRDSLAARFGGLEGMPGEWIEPWWYLHQAALRMEHPERAMLCRPSESGGLQFLASADDITVSRYVPFFVDTHPEMPVARATAARVVELVEQARLFERCRERGRAPCSGRYDGMMIQVSDGREMTLSYSDKGVIICSDNTRYFRWAYEIVQPELLALLQDMNAAFVAERSGYPALGDDRPAGMPN